MNLLHVLDLLQPVLRTVSRVPMQGNATKDNAKHSSNEDCSISMVLTFKYNVIWQFDKIQ